MSQFVSNIIAIFEFRSSHVRALSEARFREGGGGKILWHAFDKAVRRKPLSGAAGATYGLINGMNPPVPEVTVLIRKVTTDRREGVYELHIKSVLAFKHWDRRRKIPKR